MPFGIQTKGFVVGLIVGGLVLPRVVAAVSARKA